MRAKPSYLARACLALLVVHPIASAREAEAQATPAQSASTNQTPKVDEKAAGIIERAVRAMGGAAYLGVKTVVSQGHLTQIDARGTGLPVAFRDLMVFPDRERTEFRGALVRLVQVDTGETGWVFDAIKKQINDIKPEQVEDFRVSMRTSVDNVLRGWWRADGASLAYVGRREAGVGRRNEVVRLTYPDGFAVEFEFGATDGLPAKALYKRQNAQGEVVDEEDRYAQFQTIGGVQTPFIVDHYRAGEQSSRVNYDSVEFNAPVPDSLFAKPANIKAIKF
jgi:hypothetical protein